MLWHKAWLETRSRFLIGLAVVVIAGFGIMFDYRATEKLMPFARTIDPSTIDTSGPLGATIRSALEAQRDYRGFVWFQWFKQNLANLVTLFAALLGSGGLVSTAAGRGTLFTLSLPITRSRLVGVRAAVGLAELFALALVPSLLLPLCSPSIGQSYSVVDAVAHGLCVFVVGTVFFSLASLLSTEFADFWRPLLIVCLVAMVAAVVEYVPGISPYGLFRVMSGETYFRHAGLPWVGLLISAAMSATLLRAAALNLAHRDF